MIVSCKRCGKNREVEKTGELPSTYEKRRPLCPSCGKIKKMETQGGIGNRWKGGRHIDSKGYVRVWNRELKEYRKEHTAVWESFFGKVSAGFIIHHKDGNKQNNTIENLKCLPKVTHDKLGKEPRRQGVIRWWKKRKELLYV